MLEKEIEIRTADGTADAVLFQPQDRGRWPGVIHLPDIMGIRPAHREMARRLASRGYAVLLVNVFYRTGKSPLWSFPLKMGEERTMKRFAELAGPLSPEAMERDASAYVDFLGEQESVARGPLGVAGYCFTGAMAMRAAAARSERIAAVASFHGGRLFTDEPASPHTLLPRIKARLYFGHAVEDQTMPKEAIEKLEKALAAWDGRSESETYQGARHGWTVPDSAAYNAPQADRALEKMTSLFQAALNGGK